MSARRLARIGGELPHEEPGSRKVSLMARKRRTYGTGCLLQKGKGWAIRWREPEIGRDGIRRLGLRYESLGEISRKEAADILAQRVAACTLSKACGRSRVPFRKIAEHWRKSVVPMYKHSTQKNHIHNLEKHLLPRFGDIPMLEITRQGIQEYVVQLTQRGYAPRSVDHIHDTLSALLRTAVKWGHLPSNPSREVDLPKLRNVKPKWALTIDQAKSLVDLLPPLPRTIVGLSLLTGLRRGEVFALRWRDLDDQPGTLLVREAVYEGTFDTPKTEAGVRAIPLSESAQSLIERWRPQSGRTEPSALVFGTWRGKPISPNNVARSWIYPACDKLGIRRSLFLTYRRTYCSWAHDMGVPAKVVAQLMGHAKVDTTLNIYTQVLDGAARAAATKIGSQLFTTEQGSETVGSAS